MYRDPLDARYTKEPNDPSWQRLAGCAVLVVATLLVLWSAANPLAGVTVAAGAVGLFVVMRRTVPLIRCLATCGGVVLSVTEDVQVCVVRPSADSPC